MAPNDAPPPPPPAGAAAPSPARSPAKSPQAPLQRKAKTPVAAGGGGASRKKRRSIDAPAPPSSMTAPNSGSFRPKSEFSRPAEDDDNAADSPQSGDIRFYCLVASATMTGVSAVLMIGSGIFLFFG